LVLRTVAILLAVLGSAMFLADYLTTRSAPRFNGHVYLTKDRPESIAVAAATAANTLADTDNFLHGISAADIPFDDPRTGDMWTNPHQTYDVLRLPFSLVLNEMTVLNPAHVENYLESESAYGPSRGRISVHEGDTLPLPGTTAHIQAIRPWAGLLRAPNGAPCVNVALRTPANEWLDNLILTDGAWMRAGTDLALHFVWYPSQDSARAAIVSENAAPTTESARWGVIDGGGVNWRESFALGSGLVLRDNTAVTLAQVDLNHETGAGPVPAILLQIEKDGKRTLQWVLANSGGPNAQYQFDYPAARDIVLVLHGWQDGGCIVTASIRRKPAGDHRLTEGQSWNLDDTRYGFRLDQVLSSGVPVNAQQSPLSELLLSTAERSWRLKQDETVTIADTRLTFRQYITPPWTRITLSAIRFGTQNLLPITLEPGATCRIDDVTLSQGDIDARNLNAVTLAVALRPAHGLAFVGLGPFLMGILILLLTRRIQS